MLKKMIPTPHWAQRGNIRWAWWCWEPIDHYQRTGINLAQSSSEWLLKWYDRIHSEETVKMMAEMGINLAVTHFFKGMGKKFEEPEMERTKKLVQLCHKHGIYVIGYTQLGSIYNEIFPQEKKNVKNWVCRDKEGRLQSYFDNYWRWIPCIYSKEWIEYVKGMIYYGTEKIKLDGFHFDNTSSRPCYCNECKKRFSLYLQEKYATDIRERFGIASFDNINIPHSYSNSNQHIPEVIHEPLRQEWIFFRSERLIAVYADLNSYIKSLNPEAVMLGNYSCWCHGVGWSDDRGIWIPDIFATHDYVFAENENVPGVDEDGIITHQIKALKMARAGNLPVFSTTGVRNKDNWDTDAFAIDIAEAAAFGGVPGSTWALRPVHGKFAIDNPEYAHLLKKYMHFLKTHSDLYCDATEDADVAILHCEHSFAWDAMECWESRVGMEEILIAYHIPYRIIFDKDINLTEDINLLIIPDIKCISDELVKKIVEFVHCNGKVLITGESGWYKEDFGERECNAFKNIFDYESVIYLPEAPEKAAFKTKSQRKVPLPQGIDKIIKSIEKLYKPVFKIDAPKTTAIEITMLPDKCRVIHIINYANKGNRAVKITITCPESIKKASIYSPDVNDVKNIQILLPFTIDVQTYCIVVMEEK